MYLQNKYTRWYYQIISRAQVRAIGIDVYTEKHHIIPKSLGGLNSKDNLVKITAREHFICHWLLTKMVEGTRPRYQMYNAFSCMLWRQNKNQNRYKINSKLFEQLKTNHSELKSQYLINVNNGMFGRKHSEDTKQKMRDAHRNVVRVYSEETKQKFKNGNKKTGPNLKLRGENNANKKPGVREKMKATFLEKYGYDSPTKIPYKCEHCGKEGTGLGNYKRYHSNNCKSIIL